MLKVEQGDLLELSGIPFPVMVVSNDLFNGSGKAVVCPVSRDAAPGPLHIELKDCPVSGFVVCEQLKYVDLSSRRFAKISAAHYSDIMNISDAVMGIFDYQVF
jgi:mRNA-degrading endonuclease toxin of MazEF toxin-antitoxin module